ncbi:MAG: ABC transporter ATP-binding protein [Planctomycetes bacterium]|nr:ABC transporter ATP-binding protein [Planctomycetota bacterium]
MSGRPLAIHAEGLWKTYRVHPPGVPRRLWRNPTVEFHALRGVELEVEEGAVLGVVGRNGAGKSTLLKVLSRITDPTEGRVRVAGRVASLLEVGTGFHPELTGLENLYLNAAIHGLRRQDVRQRLDSILEFAEIGDFLNEPVKHYSSGMYLRLAFSIAAHLDPDILIVDELLAVGDAAFRERCLGKMKDVARGGRTVVLVSHDTTIVRGLCTEAVQLEAGRIVCAGRPDAVVTAYLETAERSGGTVHLDAGRLALQEKRAEYEVVRPGASCVSVELELAARESIDDLTVDFILVGPEGAKLAHIAGSILGSPSTTLRSGQGARFALRCDLPELAPGKYSGEIYLEARGWTGLLHVTELPLFLVGPSPMRPECLAPNFTAVLLPGHEVTLEAHG